MGFEGAMQNGGATDVRDRPGSRRSRLAGAGKQLAIALEDVDLDAEPAVGAALAEAVSAVDRAARLSASSERPHEPARTDDGAGPSGGDAGAERTPEARERSLQHLLTEAHAE